MALEPVRYKALLATQLNLPTTSSQIAMETERDDLRLVRSKAELYFYFQLGNVLSVRDRYQF